MSRRFVPYRFAAARHPAMVNDLEAAPGNADHRMSAQARAPMRMHIELRCLASHSAPLFGIACLIGSMPALFSFASRAGQLLGSCPLSVFAT
jgi:hypothetical protein